MSRGSQVQVPRRHLGSRSLHRWRSRLRDLPIIRRVPLARRVKPDFELLVASALWFEQLGLRFFLWGCRLGISGIGVGVVAEGFWLGVGGGFGSVTVGDS